MKHLLLILLMLLLPLTACDESSGDDTGDFEDTEGPADTETPEETDGVDTSAEACLDDIAWYSENSVGFANPVGQKEANGFGLYDMLGNNIEWVADCYHETYDGAPTDGTIWDEADCEYRIVRGGCFGGPDSTLRVSRRDAALPTAYGACTTGVRCVADGEPDNSAYPDLDLVWVEIPAGTMAMGCGDGGSYDCLDNEFPVHEVTLPSFYMTQTEVTGGDYWDVIAINPNVDADCLECAASKVDFPYAQQFCEAVGGRLPTEAEWEYAARGGTEGAYYCMEN